MLGDVFPGKFAEDATAAGGTGGVNEGRGVVGRTCAVGVLGGLCYGIISVPDVFIVTVVVAVAIVTVDVNTVDVTVDNILASNTVDVSVAVTVDVTTDVDTVDVIPFDLA